MRISSFQKYELLQRNMASAEGRLVSAQSMLASGKRLERPSDDPFGAHAVLLFRASKSLTDQHRKAAQAGAADLRMAESALGEIGDLMKRAKVLTVQGATATVDQSGRQALAEQIRSLKSRVVELANSRDAGGHYLFAGFRVDKTPFALGPTPPYLEYQGDQGVQFVEVGPGLTLPKNVLADQQVIDAYSALEDAEQRLLAGDISGLSGVTLELIDDATNGIQLLRAEAGSRVNQFEWAESQAANRSDEFARQISDREDADLAQTIVEMQTAQTAYQAALAAFSSTAGLSLLDYIRG